MELVSLAGLLVLIGCVVGLLALVAAPIVLALFIVGVVLKLAFFVVLLPFRLVGVMFGVGKGLLLGAVFAFLLLLGALPLLPFLIIAAGVYLVFRGMRSRSAPVGHA